MQDSMRIGAAALGGYVLGRTKKGKAAVSLALWLSGRGRPRDFVRAQAVKALQTERGQELMTQVRGPVASAGRQAALSVFEAQAGRLTDSMKRRTDSLADVSSGGGSQAGRKASKTAERLGEGRRRQSGRRPDDARRPRRRRSESSEDDGDEYAAAAPEADESEEEDEYADDQHGGAEDEYEEAEDEYEYDEEEAADEAEDEYEEAEDEYEEDEEVADEAEDEYEEPADEYEEDEGDDEVRDVDEYEEPEAEDDYERESSRRRQPRQRASA